MSPKLRKQVAIEIAQLRRLLHSHRPLIEAIATEPPDTIGLSALAAVLHSFYTGIENVFKRIAVELDSGPPTGDASHRRLLNSMAAAGPARLAVISPGLRDVLRGYLDFRHVFRHAYTFDLRWAKMAKLVRGCENTLGRLEAELHAFLRASPGD